MSRQLEKLLAVARLPHVTLQVLPFPVEHIRGSTDRS
jgi:hypothetical protein